MYFLDRLDPELFSPLGPILLDTDVNQVVSAEDEEAKFVLGKVNAIQSKPITSGMYSATDQFSYESHYGFKAVLERGNLGLIQGGNVV